MSITLPGHGRVDRHTSRRRRLGTVFSAVLAFGLAAQLHVFGSAGEGTASAAVSIQPLVAGKTLSGVIIKGGIPAVTSFGNWRGRPVDVVTSYLATDTWQGITNVSGEALTEYLAGSSVHRVWSVPMLPTHESASLQTEADGGYNDKFATVAKALIAGGDGSSTIRLGWEMTGDWYPWAGAKNPSAFIGAWRQIVDTMRAQPGANFTFDFNIAMFNSDPANLYPGDRYVDLVGADNYDDSFAWQYPASDHVQVWNYIRTGPYGLDWLGNFAKSHGKRLSFPEWGVSKRCDKYSGNDDPYFMQQFHNWIASHDVAYETYSEFAENSCRNFVLTSGAFPQAAALYQKLSAAGPVYYGGGSSTPPPTNPPPTTQPPVTGSLSVTSVKVSNLENRAGSWNLDGSTLSGSSYIYLDAPDGTVRVQFWLDTPTSDPASATEKWDPWDFSGTNGSGANDWDASKTWAGEHTLVVKATLSNGDVQSVTATFTTN
jgi:hypothetical protein